MRTQTTSHEVARARRAPRPARTDAAIIAQYIQDLARTSSDPHQLTELTETI